MSSGHIIMYMLLAKEIHNTLSIVDNTISTLCVFSNNLPDSPSVVLVVSAALAITCRAAVRRIHYYIYYTMA